MAELKRGQREIRDSKLTVVENHYPHRDYQIDITLPEFTCLCPITGYPDFATIHVTYVPDKNVIELKSLKLYINKFRDQGMFHEAVVNKILEDLTAVAKPRYMKIVGDFNPRGNVKTVVTAEYKGEENID